MPTPSPATLPADTIQRALGEFQIVLDDSQVLKIQQYTNILLAWNEKINLTAIRDPLEILNRHFCECMYAASTVPVEGGRLADVGSGAGFPGLPLKIIRPELEVILIESNIKKATFLAEVIRDLGLKALGCSSAAMKSCLRRLRRSISSARERWENLHRSWSGHTRKRLQQNRLSSGLEPGTCWKSKRYKLGSGASPSRCHIR